MIVAACSPEGVVFCSKAGSWSMTCRMTMPNGCNLRGLPLTYIIASAEELVVYVPSEAARGVARLDCLAEKQMENIAGKDPIDTSDSEESMLEEDPELADDLRNIILDERGEDQPCQVGTAADPVMDPQVEAVASTPSPDAATLPTEEALGEPTLPSSNQTESPETQDLGVEDSVVLLREEEMTDFP